MRRLLHPYRDWVNTRWFDVTRRVTTCGEEAAAGNGHQPAWTSVVRFWFDRLLAEPDFLERRFIDIGCGKGKVLCAWGERLRGNLIHQEIYGIEYERALVDQAGVNLSRMRLPHALYVADATTWPYASFRRPLIAWLFNPFGEQQMRQLVHQLEGTDTLLVYHNPQHAGAFMDAGWWPLSIKPGVHEKDTSMLLTNRGPA